MDKIVRQVWRQYIEFPADSVTAINLARAMVRSSGHVELSLFRVYSPDLNAFLQELNPDQILLHQVPLNILTQCVFKPLIREHDFTIDLPPSYSSLLYNPELRIVCINYEYHSRSYSYDTAQAAFTFEKEDWIGNDRWNYIPDWIGQNSDNCFEISLSDLIEISLSDLIFHGQEPFCEVFTKARNDFFSGSTHNYFLDKVPFLEREVPITLIKIPPVNTRHQKRKFKEAMEYWQQNIGSVNTPTIYLKYSFRGGYSLNRSGNYSSYISTKAYLKVLSQSGAYTVFPAYVPCHYPCQPIPDSAKIN